MKPKRITVVHGYFLGDSGSAVYVRELAREFTRQGHDVTLVCQEDGATDYGFIDSFYKLDGSNSMISPLSERGATGAGSCRLVRPDLDGKLLTYVPGPFAGFDAVAFQDATKQCIGEYIDRNIKALSTIFSRWPPGFVQANHLVMQPFLVERVLGGAVPYCATIHGSALNFTVKADDRMVPYALAGLEGAAFVTALSETSRADVVAFAAANGLDVESKVLQVPPGVDARLMAPIPEKDRQAVLRTVAPAIGKDSAVGVFAGRLLWTKGLHYAIAALPLILQSVPDFHLIVVGEGPLENSLRRLIGLLDAGSLESARQLAADGFGTPAVAGYGPVIPEFDADGEAAYVAAARDIIQQRVHFTGHLDHGRLAPIFAAADISLAPSVFPEAFALVSIEALAAGALPLVTYQTGLREAADIVATDLGDPGFRQLALDGNLTGSLAAAAARSLQRYPTRDAAFRRRLHQLAERTFSWGVVASRYLELAAGGKNDGLRK